MKKDITSKEDITVLITTFYEKVRKNELLAPFFKHLDFEKHLPKMIHFWSFALLDEAGYTTDVTQKHIHMRLKQEHFDAWLKLFNETVDELFDGPTASAAKQRAYLVGWTIASKMNH